jgi:hypothetical protein
MAPKQPYVEVPYVPEEAPPERREKRMSFKKPMLVPVLILVMAIIAGYYAYQMYKSSHSDDTSLVAESGTVTTSTPSTTSTTPATPVVSTTDPSTTNPPTVDASTQPALVARGTTSLPGDVPVSDSEPGMPPNGKAYTGSGHLELYREGNLTYQYNTDTGATCILYASLEEWRKPIVYRNSCR